ncbi:hypothetical protein EPUL_006073, partial [Erysiphe pulchra]
MLVRTARRKASLQSNQGRVYCGLELKLLRSKHNEIYRLYNQTTNSSVRRRSRLVQTKICEEILRAPTQRDMATTSFSRDDIPFENVNNTSSAVMGLGIGLGQPFLNPNLASTDIFTLSEKMGSRVLRRGKLGISGDFNEILPVFEACVHVGRLERAKNILDRLLDKDLPKYDAIRCINLYLRIAVEQFMMNDKSEFDRKELHDWFTSNHEIKGLPHNTEMIAYMLKFSLQSSSFKREQYVKRYMSFLDEDAFLEMIESDILTGQETSLVTEIYPKYNFVLEPEVQTLDREPLDVLNEIQGQNNLSFSKPIETKQKGLGLSTLKKSLSLFEKIESDNFDFETATYDQKREIQTRLEEDAVESAIERWREEHESLLKMGINSNLENKTLGSQMWKWQIDLEKKIHEELGRIAQAEISESRSREDIDRCLYGPLLQVLPPTHLSAITILTCMTMMGQHTDKSTPLSALVLEIGRNVEDESMLYILTNIRRKKNMEDPNDKKRCLNTEFYMKLRRSRGAGATAKHISSHFAEDGARAWPPALRAKVGALLMSSLIEVAKVHAHVQHPETKEDLVQKQPAFTHALQYKKGKKTGIILLNKVLLKQLQREPVRCLLAKQLPMLVKPDKWTGFKKGGYLVYPSQVMRIKYGDRDQRHYCEAAIAQGNMSMALDGLDVLGRTPWRINSAVYDVIIEAWNSGEAIANLPALDPKVEVPPEPVDCTDPLERGRWIRKVKISQNIKIGLHSQRCFQNFQLEIAQALKDKEFFFPHNIDFRGRAYPIPPYLNHIGADHCRGILMFGKGKELGERGLKWLKIHLSNVYGYDKASLTERENFTMSKIQEIYDSALHPMTGNKWWLTAENPWQCLASCIELKNALDSPDPNKYISHLPIHQDGTCNGLQHYAALGGDLWGAKQVNLEPGDRPADVYSAVAELVRQSVSKDKEKGSTTAAYLDGKITRKTVKQTVMTNVYGVTFIGASAQVRKQLTPPSQVMSKTENTNRQNASLYIAKKIFSALSTMFSGAHDIQSWLGECATRITTSLSSDQIFKLESEWETICAPPTENSKISDSNKRSRPLDIEEMIMFQNSVIWTSPIGMPVVQPYRTVKGKMVRTTMQSMSLAEPRKNSATNKRKQLQGFPPNFIHSLDASHMILSAIGCDDLGLSFAAVHDSFWTHACDIDTMNSVLREKFIEIHSDDIIGRLAAEFKTRFHNCMYLAKVRPAKSVHKAISKWRSKMRAEAKTKFKNSNIDKKILFNIYELLLESKRFKLLSSSDSKKVQQGKEMETPGKDANHELSSIDDGSCSNDQMQFNDEQAEGEIDVSSMGFESNEEGNLDEQMLEDLESGDLDDAQLSMLEKTIVKSKSKPKSKKSPKYAVIWLPLTIPDIPKKA